MYRKWHPLDKGTRKFIICITLVAILLIVFNYFFPAKQPFEQLEQEFVLSESKTLLDDQRSTLWPLLVTIAVTMVGTLITSYIFMKDSLDRTSEEKPYYREAIQRYRKEIVKLLWFYVRIVLILMGVVIALYTLWYYGNGRIETGLRITLIVCLGGCSIAVSIYFLWKCIFLSRGLRMYADQLLLEKYEKLEETSIILKTTAVHFRELLKLDHEKTANLEEWLQIEEEQTESAGRISREKFINRFCQWEKLLKLLVEQESVDSMPSGQTLVQRMEIILQKQQNIPDQETEQRDAEENSWNAESWQALKKCEESLSLESRDKESKVFLDTFSLLASCRDLLMVLQDTEEADRQNLGKYRQELLKGGQIPRLFTFMLLYSSVRLFRTIPRIQVFIPAEDFWYANFYNVRFEDSAFRASSFQYSIFARSKLFNTNFSMAKFDTCEFYNVDSRNCSYSNTLIENSGFQEAVFVDVDFTGTVFRRCRLDRSKFQDSILSNLELEKVSFGTGNKDFTNSKIWNVTIRGKLSDPMRNCNFTSCSIQDIDFYPEDAELYKSNETTLPEDMDPFARAFLGFCICEDLQSYYWSEVKKDRKIREEIRKFPEDGLTGFEITAITGGERQLKHPKERTVWPVIRAAAKTDLRDSIFNQAEMPRIRFYRTDLRQCVFRNAQMGEAQIVASVLQGSILLGANLREAAVFGADLRSSVLEDAIFYQAVCRLVNLEDSSLRRLHASAADFACCSFARSDCTEIDLTSARLSQCSLMDAILTGAEMTQAQFDRVEFKNSIANDMLSSYSRFQHCDFTNALLSRSSLNYTVFEKCRLELANFKDSTVMNVEFHECDFKDSNFSDTCFINACFEDNKNLEPDLFQGAKFIRCEFKGTDIKFKKKLKRQGFDIQE